MEQKKNRIIKTRISEEDYVELKKGIEASGLSESEFLRRAVKGIQISGNNAASQKMMVHIVHIQTILNRARITMDHPCIAEIQEEVSELCQYLS